MFTFSTMRDTFCRATCKRYLLAYCCGFVISVSAVAGASAQQQADPLASSQQRSQARVGHLNEQLGSQKGPAILTDPVNRPELPPAGGPAVVLKSVTFEPSSAFLGPAELDEITGKYLRGPIDFRQVAGLVQEVNDLYAKKGVVTAAGILPPQDLTDGNLEVKLVEGRLGNVSIVGDHNTRSDYVLDRLRLTRGGDIIDVPTAATDITYFNKTNRAQLRLLLQPGASFGLTDLALGISEPPSNLLQFFVGNEGSQSTGEVQFGGNLRNYGTLGVDDSLVISGTASRGSVAGTASYDIPITRIGTRMAASYTGSAIQVINGPTAPLNITGLSQAVTSTVSQPLWAMEDWQLLTTASLSKVYSTSKAGVVPLVDTDTTKGVFGLSVTYAAEGVHLNIQPQIVYANVQNMLGGDSRDIALVNGSARGLFTLPGGWSLQGQAAFQHSVDVLLPGNLLFQIGGPSTVRGYPSDGVAGDSGYYGQLELHKSLEGITPGLGTFVFTDIGEVFSTFPVRTTLISAGIGLTYNWDGRASVELTAAAPAHQALANQGFGGIYGSVSFSAF